MSTHYSFLNPGTWCGSEEEDRTLLSNEPKSNAVGNEEIEELASKIDIDVHGRVAYTLITCVLGSAVCNKCVLGNTQACCHIACLVKVY